MIVSATTDGGQAVASGKVTPVVWWASVGTRIVTHRRPAAPKRHELPHHEIAN